MSTHVKPTIAFGIPKLPARYANVLMPLLLSILMTGVISLIGVLKSVGLHSPMMGSWMISWGVAWLISYPVLLLVQPAVRKVTGMLVLLPAEEPPQKSNQDGRQGIKATGC